MEKKCKNCKFFVQHYVILSNATISKINCGHCVKKRADAKLIPLSEKACALWESNEENEKRLEKAIDYYIKEFAKQLYHIAQIKKAD